MLCYSYGSGAAASVFAMKVKSAPTEIAEKLQFTERLDAMNIVPCEDFVKALNVSIPSSSPPSSAFLFREPDVCSSVLLFADPREEPQRLVLHSRWIAGRPLGWSLLPC